MDCYPIKDKIHIAFVQIDTDEINRRYDIWRTEAERRAANAA